VTRPIILINYILPASSFLQIDYGVRYERVRVRKGYSRLTKKQREEIIQSLNDDDLITLSDWSRYSVNDIEQVLRFLESLVESNWRPPEQSLKRALTASLVLRKRVRDVIEDFKGLEGRVFSEGICDNGYSSMAVNKVGQRSQATVRKLCGKFEDEDNLKDSILSINVLKTAVAQCLMLDDLAEIESLHASDLYQRLLSF
jgi:hypothetical protein